MMSENPDDLKSQLVDLQTQLAFQEDTIAALDRVVAGQQREIGRLTLICERLARQFDQLSASWAEQQEPQVPPHY
jgi:SlyX protein